MNCPKCAKGNIRVITVAVCSCGHHEMLCDGCYAIFQVPCGAPYGRMALPPEVPMQEDERMAKVAADMADRHGGPSLPEILKDMLRTQPDQLPLLEDFKRNLPAESTLDDNEF